MDDSAVSSTPRFSPTVTLVRLAREADLELARVLEPRGLTVRKLALLQRIARTPGLSPAELARSIGVATSDVERLITGLTAASLVRAGRSPGGHAPQLTATESAGRVLADVDAAIAELDDRLFGSAALRELADALRAATATVPAPPQD